MTDERHTFVVLTMQDNSERTLPTRQVLRLLDDATSAMGPTSWPIPERVYEQFPELAWFRDCRSSYSEGGGHVQDLILAFVRGPVAMPAGSSADLEAPPFD